MNPTPIFSGTVLDGKVRIKDKHLYDNHLTSLEGNALFFSYLYAKDLAK